MIQSLQSRHCRCLVGLVALAYGALLVMAGGCAFAHMSGSQGHHPHHEEQGPSSQNVLCAWVCQTTSDLGAVAQLPVAGVWLIVEPQFLVSDSQYSYAIPATLLPRAPPSSLFLSHG